MLVTTTPAPTPTPIWFSFNVRIFPQSTETYPAVPTSAGISTAETSRLWLLSVAWVVTRLSVTRACVLGWKLVVANIPPTETSVPDETATSTPALNTRLRV